MKLKRSTHHSYSQKSAYTERFLETLINMNPDIIYIYSLNERKNLYTNNGIQKVLGYSVEEIQQMGNLIIPTLMHPDDYKIYIEETFPRYGLLADEEQLNHQFRMKHKAGSWHMLDCNEMIFERNDDNSPSQIFGVIHDVSGRKTAEMALRESEEKYRTLFNTMTQGVIYQDADGKIISANPAAERILGLSLDQLEGKTSVDPRWKAIREDGSDFPGTEHPITLALQTGQKICNVVHGIYNPETEQTVWIKVSATPLFKKGETKPFQAYATIEDVTEQRVSEKKYTMLFREMLDGFALHEIIVDEDGKPVDYRFLDVNPSFERMTGLSRENIIGKRVLEIMPGTEHYWIEKYGNVALSGKPDFFQNYAVEIGKHFEVTTYRPAQGQFACIFSDVTERKRTEELLKNTQKLESLGILAGGIAHDFNNLLGGIYGYLDLANETVKDSETASYLKKCLQTIERARGLTRQLLTFSKGGEPVKEVSCLFPLIKETALFALSGSNVSLKEKIPEDLWLCDFDKNQIGQVIDNIVINAQQAMPQGGVLTLIAENCEIRENEHPLLGQGRYCRISFSDSGIGISPEILPNIFDPFFTTKSKGHGLGLATCFSIISRHGGCIDVESKQGIGSTFQIYLPASIHSETDLNTCLDEGFRGSGTFIIMDDEQVIRDTLKGMLSGFGFIVVEKENGDEAVSFFEEQSLSGKTTSGIILDLTIPGGMGGKEAIQLIRKIDASIPVFVVSGFAEDPIIANPQNYGFTASIPKPFRKSDLESILKKYL